MLDVENLSPDVIRSVCERTPGYVAWQSELWLVHCNDACEYHGHASRSDIIEASTETVQSWMETNGMTFSDWEYYTDGYHPDGAIAFYRFVCRHCGVILFHWDMS